MIQKKLTNRQIQALKTKEKIYDIAIEKFAEKGLEVTSIKEICREAKVSIGSFYNYFENKEDVINETFKRADTNFEQFKERKIEDQEIPDLILEYMDYYINFVLTNDIKFIKVLYNTGNQLFVQGNRPMQEVLKSILRGRRLEVNKYYVEDTDVLVDMLFMTSRGVIFHWCLKDGDFDLKEMNHKQMEMVLATVLKK